jgi:glycosyltransferase involved in cell wall biosynthesis
MKVTEKKILLFIKVPPPITGATLMNKQVSDSKLLNENFKIRSLLISYAQSINDLGKFNFSKLFIFIKIFRTLIKECIYNRPRFIYFQISPLGISFYRDLIFISVIKLFKIEIVYHLHGKGIKKVVENRFLAMPYKFAFRNSRIICLSNLLTDDLKAVFKGPFEIVNNGIPEIPEEKILEYQLGKNSDKIQILFLSNLIRSKGILEFIESLKILANKKFDFRANIIGAESNIKSSYVIDKIDGYNLKDKVSYLGTKFGNEKNELIAKSDVLVYPSLNDSFPLVLLEVMQFGKPIIATDEGAISEIVDNGLTGFIVEKNNPQAISEKLEFLIRSKEIRIKMGNAGRQKFLDSYTLALFEANMKNVFDEVLKRNCIDK